MKNNIIVAGVPRAGKSTVSHLLATKYGYQHVSMDSIIAGFEKCFPETGVSTYIVYFITSDVTPEERFQIQKKYDTEKDYTFYKPDEELREGAEYIVEQSILMKAQCEKLGLPYYETARDREQVFMQFLRDFGFI